jgi:hypothetical protein
MTHLLYLLRRWVSSRVEEIYIKINPKINFIVRSTCTVHTYLSAPHNEIDSGVILLYISSTLIPLNKTFRVRVNQRDRFP